jgi:hypothetical protein
MSRFTPRSRFCFTPVRAALFSFQRRFIGLRFGENRREADERRNAMTLSTALKPFHPELNAGCLISLLCEDYLWKESLADETQVRRWFTQVDRRQTAGWEEWVKLTSAVISADAEQNFRGVLQRPLRRGELFYLRRKVEEFVKVYALTHLNVSYV